MSNKAAKKLLLTLDPKAVQQVIAELQDYKIWMNNKCKELEYRICEEIKNYAQTSYNLAYWESWTKEGGTEHHNVSVNVSVVRDTTVSVVIADGEDAVWAEFGTGVYYNGSVGQSPNPYGDKLGFTIGSYGYGNGRKETWGYYDEATGDLTFTRGVAATMPLYHAVQETVWFKLPTLAKEVFSRD